MNVGGDISKLFDPNLSLAVFVLFCRIGGCLMLMPGVASAQIPMQIRALVAVAVTLSLTPLLLDQAPLRALSSDPLPALRLIGLETAIGVTIGLLGRMLFLALETMAVGAATMLGLANPFGIEVEANQVMPPLANLIVLSATALIFITDADWEVLRGIVASYHVIPMGADFDPGYSLRQVVGTLAESFRVALRICSPFFLYAVTVNLAMSLINRLTPQVAIFYVATPFIVAGGLLLLYFTARPMLTEFIAAFASWLSAG
jgi:flagellar biosynthesis protein FliR